ncbi:leukemia inhibitory factor [Mixophyes fleayi]|uniref:leukemia inhibitory factor n=1 Tax=Mixophyes fleayi TaxID=3061075 RepID=UPI003F4DD179
MQLVAGIVQLLILQQWALLTGRANPLNAVKPLCANVSDCNNNLTVIMTQIKLKIKQMHTEAKDLFHTYVDENFSDNMNVSNLCSPDSIDFPKFNVSNTSEKEKMVELYKIFQYMTAAIANITQDQMNLNPQKKILHSQLNTSKAEITAVISNLSCILCRRYQITEVDVHYGIRFPTNTFSKKKTGCKVLKKYKHFLSQASEMASDWSEEVEYTQDRINKHQG